MTYKQQDVCYHVYVTLLSLPCETLVFTGFYIFESLPFCPFIT